MINDIHTDTEIRMKKCIEIFITRISKFRTGRISSNLLDDIKVMYHNSYIPLYQLADVIIKNSNTLALTVFDRTMISVIEKALLTSNLGINPVSQGNIIYISLPPLTEEYRRNLIKIIKTEAEHSKILVRNLRRDANLKIKNSFKDNIISLDKERHLQKIIQDLTNTYIKNIDKLLIKKETELSKL